MGRLESLRHAGRPFQAASGTEQIRMSSEGVETTSPPASGDRQAPAKRLKTKKRVLTRRGVIWLGQTCNQRCFFCYFIDAISDPHRPDHAFMSLEKAKAICRTLREFYGNTSVDIQGGEPTIFPDIIELVRYCRQIGLYPTLITNGLVLAKPGVLEAYKEAGVRDFLVSLHGLGEVHDQVVGNEGAHERIVAAIERMRALDIPFRYNCTMSKPVIPLLPAIARHAVEFGAYIVNYIHFNPYRDQETGRRSRENVATYAEIKPYLAEAIDLLEEAGIEANVRYLPLCMAEERHRKNFYNWQQLPYDTHEWDIESWMWSMMGPQTLKDGGLFPPFRLGPGARGIMHGDPFGPRDRYEQGSRRERVRFAMQRAGARVAQAVLGKEVLLREEARRRTHWDLRYRYYSACGRCAVRSICDGFAGDYAELFESDEAEAVSTMPGTDNPLYYISRQVKVVEPEDKEWAM